MLVPEFDDGVALTVTVTAVRVGLTHGPFTPCI